MIIKCSKNFLLDKTEIPKRSRWLIFIGARSGELLLINELKIVISKFFSTKILNQKILEIQKLISEPFAGRLNLLTILLVDLESSFFVLLLEFSVHLKVILRITYSDRLRILLKICLYLKV